ncbi:MAG: IS630 family transposase [Nitrososphaera sp.]|nr:IS630 family transposase [Nitrososphaera sp.]
MAIRYVIDLTDAERAALREILSKNKVKRSTIIKAYILLKADRSCGWTNADIASAYDVSTKKVEQLKKRFVEEGFEAALYRKPVTNAHRRKITGDEEAHLIALCCSQAPEGQERWTLRMLADKMVELDVIASVSHETIRRTLKKGELKPWQKKEWCIPPEHDAAFVCQMEEVLDIYKTPYDPQCPQVCVDEMSTQLIGEVRAPLPAEPEKPLRYDTEYKRNGTANIFIAFEPLTGQRQTKVTAQRTKVDWAHFIRELVDQHYPHVEKIRLVMDNLNTHTKASLYEAFDPPEAKRIADKLEVHYTPKHGSWLNMAEIELSHLSRQCLGGRIAAKTTLINKVQAWNTQRNAKHAKAQWQFTTDDARVKLSRLYPIVST